MAIAKRLNAEGVPGTNGNPWQDTTIRGYAKRGTGILRDELCIGRLLWNRQRFVRDPQTGKGTFRINPTNEWIVEDAPELRIVDDELWGRTKARLDEIATSPVALAIRENAIWTGKRVQNIPTSLVHCGACGHPMAAVGKDYLRCSRAHRNALCTSKASIRRSTLVEIIIKARQHNLVASDLVKEFVAAANEEFNRTRAEATAERDGYAARLSKIDKQIDSLVDAIANGARTASIQSKLEALETERANLHVKLSEPPPSPVRLLPNLAEPTARK